MIVADAPTAPALPTNIPVIPLREAVVLPMTVAPLGVSRPMSIEAVNRALAADRMVLLLLQKDDERRSRAGRSPACRHGRDHPADGQIAGRDARHRRRHGPRAGGVPAGRQGRAVARSSRCCRSRRSVRSRSMRTCAGCRNWSIVRSRWQPGSPPTSRHSSGALDDPLRIAYLMASLLDIKAEEKQHLLEENSLVTQAGYRLHCPRARNRSARAERPHRIEGREGDDRCAAAVSAAPAAEGDPVRARRRRQSRLQEIRKRVLDANLPGQVASVALREVDRLERMTPASPEYQMIRTYLDWVLDVPWNTTTEDRLGSRRRTPGTRRRPLRSRQSQRPHRRVSRCAES